MKFPVSPLRVCHPDPAPNSGFSAADDARAILNILEDFGDEKTRLADTQRAVLNILEDFGDEKTRLADTQRAVLNILEDFGEEKTRLADTQRAVLNILEDFDHEKAKVDEANLELRAEITQRRRVEEDLARSNAELEMFASVASHDLREPLRMISSYIQLLTRRYQGRLDADADEFIGFILEGTKRMGALIDDLLAYSRVGSARTVEFAPTDCEVVFTQASASLRTMQQESGAVVTHDPLPTILADAPQLIQLFQNLLDNAMKFRGEEPPTIHMNAQPVPGGWQFRVSDNGIGVDAAYAERVFDAFERLHRRRYPGTGMGLAICKKIVERHGGRIWVESPLGKGSTFCFVLKPVPQ